MLKNNSQHLLGHNTRPIVKFMAKKTLASKEERVERFYLNKMLSKTISLILYWLFQLPHLLLDQQPHQAACQSLL